MQRVRQLRSQKRKKSQSTVILNLQKKICFLRAGDRLGGVGISCQGGRRCIFWGEVYFRGFGEWCILGGIFLGVVYLGGCIFWG